MINGNTELEQSILRIFLVCGFLVYSIIVEFLLVDGSGGAYTAIIIGIFYSIASIVIFFRIKKYPGYYRTRRIIGMVSDIAATSFSMYYLGEYGVPLFAAYPWVIIGNGFRYGIKYLVFCSILSVGP